MIGYVTHISPKPRLSSMPGTPVEKRQPLTEDELREAMMKAGGATDSPRLPEERKPYALGAESNADRVRMLMERGGQHTLKGMAAELGIKKDSVSNAIARLRALKFEIGTEKGAGGVHVYWMEDAK